MKILVKLMDCVNTVRERVWKEGRKEALEEFFPMQMEYECYRTVKNTLR